MTDLLTTAVRGVMLVILAGCIPVAVALLAQMLTGTYSDDLR